MNLHHENTKSKVAMKSCFYHYHDSCFFGLAVCDAKAVGRQASRGVTPPTNEARKKQKNNDLATALQILVLQKQLEAFLRVFAAMDGPSS